MNRLAAFGTALTFTDVSRRLDRVGQLAWDLLADYGLWDWSFGFNRGDRRRGQAQHHWRRPSKVRRRRPG